MEINNVQHKIIVDILVQRGSFRIGDVLEQSKLSRSGVSKVLVKLVNGKVLRCTAKRGAKVFYVLCVSEAGLRFVFTYKNKLTIDELANAWNVLPHTAQKYIKKFIDIGFVNKKGTPPNKIMYTLKNTKQLPQFLKPFLWSYNFEQIDVAKDKNIIIKNILDLGTYDSVKWVKENYSRGEIEEVIKKTIQSDWGDKSLNYWTQIYNVKPKKNRIIK